MISPPFAENPFAWVWGLLVAGAVICALLASLINGLAQVGNQLRSIRQTKSALRIDPLKAIQQHWQVKRGAITEGFVLTVSGIIFAVLSAFLLDRASEQAQAQNSSLFSLYATLLTGTVGGAILFGLIGLRKLSVSLWVPEWVVWGAWIAIFGRVAEIKYGDWETAVLFALIGAIAATYYGRITDEARAKESEERKTGFERAKNVYQVAACFTLDERRAAAIRVYDDCEPHSRRFCADQDGYDPLEYMLSLRGHGLEVRDPQVMLEALGRPTDSRLYGDIMRFREDWNEGFITDLHRALGVDINVQIELPL